jgi:ABC-type Na+ efflux pump permease subunit
MLRALIWSTWMEARRSALPLLLPLVWLLAWTMAELLATTVPTDSETTRLLVFAACARLALVFLVAVFVVSSVLREHDDRIQLWLLALPEPRSRYVTGRALGYVSVALLTALPVGLLLGLRADALDALAWTLGCAAELALVALLAQASALALRQATASLAAVLLAYLLGRSIDALRLIAAAPMLQSDSAWMHWMQDALTALSWVVPPLARFAPGHWLLGEGALAALPAVLLQALVTGSLIYAVMRVDFARRSE